MYVEQIEGRTMKYGIAAAMAAICMSASAAVTSDVELCGSYISNSEFQLAVKPCTAAAKEGYVRAQVRLGLMYYNGDGVEQDYAEAVRWFRAAAEQGRASAQFSLGLMYEDGKGVLQNYAIAHMWYNIAAANGTGELAIKNRKRIAEKMTAEQIAEAQDRAQKCMASNYTDC
jgi:TPR repeat protein